MKNKSRVEDNPMVSAEGPETQGKESDLLPQARKRARGGFSVRYKTVLFSEYERAAGIFRLWKEAAENWNSSKKADSKKWCPCTHLYI